MNHTALALTASLLVGCAGDDGGGATATIGESSTTGDEATAGTGSSGGVTTGQDTTTGATTSETTSATTSATTGEPLTRVEEILGDLGVAMYACPERIWPDVEASYRASQVLLASKVENTAWVWNFLDGAGEPPVVTEGPLDTLPAEWSAVFNVGSINGARTLGISLDWGQELNDAFELENGAPPWPDFTTTLAFHEGFHFLSSQNDWNVGDGSRTAAYPEPWEPRYLRAQLQRSLRAEIMEEGAGLGAAAYWQDRLLTEHAEEMAASRHYDCTEGSAEYVSLMMSALAELGCDAGDDELLDLAIEHLDDGVFFTEGSFSPGREFYNLGVVAGLLLRRAGLAGWELGVEDGEAPVAQLLAGVEVASQEDDAALQAEVQAAVGERNETVGAEIEPFLEAMADPEYTRIPVLFDWVGGSFGVGGFYYLADDPDEREVLLTFSAMMLTPSDVTIAIDGMTSFNGSTTPCVASGGGAIVIAVPTADLSVVGGTATSTNPKFSFMDLGVEPTMDDENLPWLCPTDAGGAKGAPAPEPGLDLGLDLHILREAGGGSQIGVTEALRALSRPEAAVLRP